MGSVGVSVRVGYNRGGTMARGRTRRREGNKDDDKKKKRDGRKGLGKEGVIKTRADA